MKISFTLLLTIIVAASCAPTRYFQPSREQNINTDILYHEGLPYIRSVLEKTEVSAQLMLKGERSLSLDVFFYNESGEPFTVEPGDISALGFNSLGVPTDLRVFTAEQFIRRRNTRDAIIGGVAIIAAVAGTVALLDNPAANNTVGNDLIFLGLTAAPTITASNRSAPFSPRDGLARSHSLLPDTAYRGLVMIQGKADYLHRIEITVPVNNMPHRFSFDNVMLTPR
jgi:hypothetical protein